MKEELDPVLSILCENHEASLGTTEDKQPHVSSVGFLFEPKGNLGQAYLLLSDLAKHTRNIKKNPKVSLLVLHRGDELPFHSKRRVTLSGICAPMTDREKFKELQKQYLRAFPQSESFFALEDFRFYEVEVVEIHYYGGFGEAKTFTA